MTTPDDNSDDHPRWQHLQMTTYLTIPDDNTNNNNLQMKTQMITQMTTPTDSCYFQVFSNIFKKSKCPHGYDVIIE
jgi:hypothetical protein